MMPKGVEHRRKPSGLTRPISVKIPMMPKGVEHSLVCDACAADIKAVKIPMMPKGVEHIPLSISSVSVCGEDSNDAERR